VGLVVFMPGSVTNVAKNSQRGYAK